MIVIPMLGRSSRFFADGYALPKYQLPLRGESVFAQSVRSFERLFDSVPFLFLVRQDHRAREFVEREVERLGIRRHRVIVFDEETRGQADSVWRGTADCDDDAPLVIFNIDTIRRDFDWPSAENFGDGFLEVFEGEGDGWSFVEPEPAVGAPACARVRRTTEKLRISNLCSNGLYGFARLRDFRDAFTEYVAGGHHVGGEVYVAPLYNHLIARGLDVRYHLVDPGRIDHCGVPADYRRLVERAAPVVDARNGPAVLRPGGGLQEVLW